MRIESKKNKSLTRLTQESRERFRENLLRWYDTERRDLPWRRTRDPYRIWVSEIMLQQTRVAAVLDHYQRFFLRFPTIQKLAAASEASVLTAWSGLGYYRRARMMHAAAREIVGQGAFPHTAEALLKLPGIGRYTAAAVASIAFSQPVAVVDGNVERVLQRLIGIKLKSAEAWQCAGELLSQPRPGDFNQAMMELGATTCLPGEPKCLMCPVAGECRTRGDFATIKSAPRQNKRELHYALNCNEKAVFLVQRAKDVSLMPSMWELPQLSPEGTVSSEAWLTLRHSITITDFTVRVLRTCEHPNGGRWIAKTRLSKLPLTGLTRKILIAAELL
ncbi:MAG TPA: A/G-specific adenine glycosylase [Terriglobales bacterium]|nr:A/G-specific adenine glycosylase [Terriglobales bacterium]